MQTARWLRFQAALLIAVSGWMVAGCTFSDVKPTMKAALPAERPQTLIIGEVRMTDERVSPLQRDHLLHSFRYGIKEWIAEHGAVLAVVDATNTVAEARSLVVTGTISTVDKGSQALRFWVGMGAGQAKMKGEFKVCDPSGKLVNEFAANRSYLGGSGIGGWDMVQMEDLSRQLGQSVGETIAEWVAGKNLDRTK